MTATELKMAANHWQTAIDVHHVTPPVMEWITGRIVEALGA